MTGLFTLSMIDQIFRVEDTQLRSTGLKNVLSCLVGGYPRELCKNKPKINVFFFLRLPKINLSSYFQTNMYHLDWHIP